MKRKEFITYTINGKTITRRSSAPTRHRVKNDPAFKGFKLNGNEHGGGATLAKSLRPDAIVPTLKQFTDSYMVGRQNAICRKLIMLGKGTLGNREASLPLNGKVLQDFPLFRGRPLSFVFNGPTKVYCNPEKTQVTLETTVGEGYHAMNKTNAPWVSVTMAIATVSNHHWNPAMNKYTPLNPDQNAWGSAIESPLMPVNEPPQTLTLSLPIECSLPLDSTTAVVVYVGTRYHIQEGFATIPILTGSAMNLHTVLS